MENDIVIQTIVPILLLIGMVFLSRKREILKSGDERVLSAYISFCSSIFSLLEKY